MARRKLKSPCIITPRYHGDYKYPQVKVDGRHISLHRLEYEKAYNRILPFMLVRHVCDNPACINPDHLLVGTHADNVQDRVDRGRSAAGERNGRSKLTESQVQEILRNKAEATRKLARDYGVSPKAIRKIKQGATWQHIS